MLTTEECPGMSAGTERFQVMLKICRVVINAVEHPSNQSRIDRSCNHRITNVGWGVGALALTSFLSLPVSAV